MDLVQAVREQLPGIRTDLDALVAIPSISADPDRAADLRRSAETVAALLAAAGCPEVRGRQRRRRHRRCIGRYPAPPGHADGLPVRPPRRPADRRRGRSGQPAVRRRPSGTTGCTVAAPATTRAGSPSTWPRCGPSAAGRRSGVTVFVEGEEEIGSPTLAAILRRDRDRLAADVYVIADSGNWAVGEPALHHHRCGAGRLRGGGPHARPRACTPACTAGWCPTR